MGKGSYSIAYEVLYKGIHCVAKITKSKDDIDNLIKLNDLKTDSRIETNLLKIYDIIYDKETQNYIIIVEYLVPTHIGLISDLWGSEENYIYEEFRYYLPQYSKEKIESINLESVKKYIKNFLTKKLKNFNISNDYFQSIEFTNICNIICEQIKEGKQNIYNTITSKNNKNYAVITSEDNYEQTRLISKELYQTFNSFLIPHIYNNEAEETEEVEEAEENNKGENSKKITNKFDEGENTKKITNKFYEMDDLDPDEDDASNLNSIIHELIYELIEVFIFKQQFPIRHGQQIKAESLLQHADPRVRQLIKALLILKNEYSIYWLDLHDLNIMMRPKTKELVISDPGLFFSF